MATTRLAIYNAALLILGARKIATLADNTESRRVLDSVWDDNAVEYCLSQGLWNFAGRSIKLDYSPSVEPPFGLRRAFNQPDDLVRTMAVCEDEYFQFPLLRYTSETRYWFADLDVIYVRYVSKDLAYGLDTSLWPEGFSKYVSAYMAERAAGRITSGKAQDELERGCKAALLQARSTDAMEEPTDFPPTGSWVSARAGRRTMGWTRARR